MSGNRNADGRTHGNTRAPITQAVGHAVTAEICESVSAALEDRVMDHITPMFDNAVYTAIERVVHGEDV